MSLAEIKEAVTELTPKELAELASFIQTQENIAWDREIEEDFSPDGKHYEVLAKIDATVAQGDWPEFPVFDGGPVDGAIQHDKYIYDEPGHVSGENARK
jgi:hypothetical protein